MRGGEAVAAQLAHLMPKRVAKGTQAKFRALSRTARGRSFLSNAGVTGTARTQRGWLSGRSPSKANAAAIDRAYETRQRENLLHRATRGDRRVTITPDSAIRARVTSRGGNMPGETTISVSSADWQAMVDAHASGDRNGMDRLWRSWVEAAIHDSPPGRAYFQVSHVTFGG